MNKPKTPRYTIDDETRELLEAALNMVSQTASLQINDEPPTEDEKMH